LQGCEQQVYDITPTPTWGIFYSLHLSSGVQCSCSQVRTSCMILSRSCVCVCIHNRTSNSLSSKICSIRRGNTSLNPCKSWNTMHTAVNIISKQSLRRSKEYSHIQTLLTRRYCYTHIHAHLTPPPTHMHVPNNAHLLNCFHLFVDSVFKSPLHQQAG